MPKLIDLTGQRFERLIVIRRMDNDKRGQSKWLCRCRCENEVIVSSYHLRNGDTKSCGCLQKEKVIINNINRTIHGHCQDRKMTGFYDSWHKMKQRCINPNHTQWKDYGGRGITVCNEWLIFENFEKDMIKGWKLGLTLERINNKLGYFKGNCEWVTMKQQNINKRNNLYVPYKDENRLFIELCEEHNMPRGIVYDRFYRLGWTLEKALTTPIRRRRKKS